MGAHFMPKTLKNAALAEKKVVQHPKNEKLLLYP